MLFKQGDFRILSDDVGRLSGSELVQLIKTAGTTCYQTRDSSKRTPEEFVQMLKKSGHFAMIEHSWRTIEIAFPGTDNIIAAKERIGFHLYKANNLFCITERPTSLLVSGNVRMFNEARIKSGNTFICDIHSLLAEESPALFPVSKPYKSYSGLEFRISPELTAKKEILIHRAMTVEFNNTSRGMTHETVRSRSGDEKVTSYAQESTRYVDYAKGEVNLDEFQMKFVLPYNDQFDFGQPMTFSVDGKGYSFTSQQFTNLMEGWYRVLRKQGLKPEEARQWLPIGIKAQIVQTYNLNEWRHWFFLRTGHRAHPEIRFVAIKLLQEVQKRVPECFNDFEINEDGKSAVYKGNDPLV
ncbi:FAD-dependent thymidylate synthase [Patescibacteria group bacterium]|nr:FAD-dependent thymidylate synthase [Patescibacteria group bacterium]